MIYGGVERIIDPTAGRETFPTKRDNEKEKNQIRDN
jgi:hypothetical protein